MPPKKGTPWKLQTEISNLHRSKELIHEQSSGESDNEVDDMLEEVQEAGMAGIEDACKGAATLDDMIKAIQKEAQEKS
eukprot:3214107-Pyramimonas_sp.AAC.1